MVSRGIPQKGWHELIVAFKRIHRIHKDAVLLLVGDSPYLRRLLSETTSRDDAIIHVGFSGDVHSWISFFDVCCLPSYYIGESCPIVLIEYLLMGKPVITTDINGISRMIVSDDKKYAGQVAEINSSGKCDVDSLCNAMSLYLTNREILKEHANNAVKMANRYRIDTVAVKYHDVFKNIIAKMHGGG